MRLPPRKIAPVLPKVFSRSRLQLFVIFSESISSKKMQILSRKRQPRKWRQTFMHIKKFGKNLRPRKGGMGRRKYIMWMHKLNKNYLKIVTGVFIICKNILAPLPNILLENIRFLPCYARVVYPLSKILENICYLEDRRHNFH